jgi:hypothetical protein
MPLFIVLILGAMLCGAGAMLSPALPTLQPRVGLAATVTLALIVGGSLFMLSLTGNDPLVIDYVLFALLSGTVLGGTIAQAQTRAEEKGEELSDTDQGWTGPQDLLFFALVGVIFAGFLLLFHPSGQGPYSPGLEMLTSYIGRQLQQIRPVVQSSIAAVVAFLCVWILYDLGSEWRSKPLGRCIALAALPTILAVFSSGRFSVLLGLLFGVAYLIFLMRAVYGGHRLDIVGAGLMLGACLYASADILVLMLVFSPVWIVILRRFPPEKIKAASQRRWVWLILPIAVVATLPWWWIHFEVVGNSLLTMTRDLNPIIAWLNVFIGGCLVGGVLLMGWHRLPLALREILRRSYYPLAVATMVVVTGLIIVESR